jgi:hypothetical protein
MTDDAIVQRLDRMIAILQLAHREAIEDARERIMGDKANEAILSAATSWTPAGKLQIVVTKKTKQSPRTVKRRIADLVAQGLLEKQGAGANVSYKTTGLI